MTSKYRLWLILINIITCVLIIIGCSGKSEEAASIPTPALLDITAQVPPTPVLTPTPSPPPAPFRFVVAGDSRGLYQDEAGKYQGEIGGVNTAVISLALSSLKQKEIQPEFIMTLGDYGMGSSDPAEAKTHYQTFLDTATQYYPESNYYACYGNHEALLKEGGIELFSEMFDEFEADEFFKPDQYGRTTYYFSSNNCNFFVLNTNAPDNPHKISDDVLEWMISQTGKGEMFNFIFIHEPAFPSGNHTDNSLDKFADQRDKFWSAVDNIPAALVFNAHEHQYARRRIDRSFSDENGNIYVNEVYQITTAGMGAPFHEDYTDSRGMVVPPRLAFHYVIVDILENQAQISAVTLDGYVLDEFFIESALPMLR